MKQTLKNIGITVGIFSALMIGLFTYIDNSKSYPDIIENAFHFNHEKVQNNAENTADFFRNKKINKFSGEIPIEIQEMMDTTDFNFETIETEIVKAKVDIESVKNLDNLIKNGELTMQDLYNDISPVFGEAVKNNEINWSWNGFDMEYTFYVAEGDELFWKTYFSHPTATMFFHEVFVDVRFENKYIPVTVSVNNQSFLKTKKFHLHDEIKIYSENNIFNETFYVDKVTSDFVSIISSDKLSKGELLINGSGAIGVIEINSEFYNYSSDENRLEFLKKINKEDLEKSEPTDEEFAKGSLKLKACFDYIVDTKNNIYFNGNNCRDERVKKTGLQFSWNFGDDTISFEKYIVHTYKKSGTYKVTMQVYDQNGYHNTIEKEIIVKRGKKFDLENDSLYKENYVWGGAMNLAWTDLSENIIKEKIDLVLNDDEVEAKKLLEKLNNPVMSKSDLSEKDYYVKSGYGQETVEQINKETKEKFPSKSFEDLKLELAPRDIIAYAYFLKEIEYKIPFTISKYDFFFNNSEIAVKSFYAETEEQKENITILNYESDDKFIISLDLKDENLKQDELILAKGYDMKNPENVINEIKNLQLSKTKFEKMDSRDFFKMPFLHIDMTREYQEFLNKFFRNIDFKDYKISKMYENIKFDLDEKGARVENEAVIGIIDTVDVGFDDKNQYKPKYFYLNSDFWLVMKEKQSLNPYFIVGVKNDEIMEKNNNL